MLFLQFHTGGVEAETNGGDGRTAGTHEWVEDGLTRDGEDFVNPTPEFEGLSERVAEGGGGIAGRQSDGGLTARLGKKSVWFRTDHCPFAVFGSVMTRRGVRTVVDLVPGNGPALDAEAGGSRRGGELLVMVEVVEEDEMGADGVEGDADEGVEVVETGSDGGLGDAGYGPVEPDGSGWHVACFARYPGRDLHRSAGHVHPAGPHGADWTDRTHRAHRAHWPAGDTRGYGTDRADWTYRPHGLAGRNRAHRTHGANRPHGPAGNTGRNRADWTHRADRPHRGAGDTGRNGSDRTYRADRAHGPYRAGSELTDLCSSDGLRHRVEWKE